MADIVVNQQGMALPMRLPRKQKVLSTVAIALTPELDKEREIRRKGSQKNHMQENVRKLREKQAALRREKQEVHAEEPFKPARSMYTGNVEARVFKDAEQKSQPQGGKKHEFLKKHEKQGAPSTLKSPVVKRPSSASASTPTRQGRSNLNQSASQDLGLVIQGKASRPSSASGSRPSSSSQPRKTKYTNVLTLLVKFRLYSPFFFFLLPFLYLLPLPPVFFTSPPFVLNFLLFYVVFFRATNELVTRGLVNLVALRRLSDCFLLLCCGILGLVKSPNI
eukprot:m.37419 g.37419  ORF g.37419 m.37419 type:complete len:278 (-) comp11379_c0_seq4:686-1519(-)